MKGATFSFFDFLEYVYMGSYYGAKCSENASLRHCLHGELLRGVVEYFLHFTLRGEVLKNTWVLGIRIIKHLWLVQKIITYFNWF